MSLHDDLVPAPSEEGGGKQSMGDVGDALEKVKNPLSAFSPEAPEWEQLELEALLEQKRLLREVQKIPICYCLSG